MTNLVARLRAIRGKLKSGEYDGGDIMEAWCAASDAADEIERLQAALTTIANGIGWPWEDYGRIALLALRASDEPREPTAGS